MLPTRACSRVLDGVAKRMVPSLVVTLGLRVRVLRGNDTTTCAHCGSSRVAHGSLGRRLGSLLLDIVVLETRLVVLAMRRVQAWIVPHMDGLAVG